MFLHDRIFVLQNYLEGVFGVIVGVVIGDASSVHLHALSKVHIQVTRWTRNNLIPEDCIFEAPM